MTRVPPEIESLIWSIAEAPSEKAVQEFHARYPAYAGELAKRIATVHALRGAGKEPVSQRPTFTPVPSRPAPTGRTATWAAGFALAAVAVASFTFAVLASRKPTPEPAPAPLPVVVHQEPPKVDTKPFLPPPDKEPQPSTDLQDGDEKPLREEAPAWSKPRHIEMHGVALTTALRAIAAGGGLSIVIDPGMPDPKIDVVYDGLNTVQVLQKMGEDYAFTAFDQGNGSVIIVPAREGDEKSTPDPERKRYSGTS